MVSKISSYKDNFMDLWQKLVKANNPYIAKDDAPPRQAALDIMVEFDKLKNKTRLLETLEAEAEAAWNSEDVDDVRWGDQTIEKLRELRKKMFPGDVCGSCHQLIEEGDTRVRGGSSCSINHHYHVDCVPERTICYKELRLAVDALEEE